MRSKAKGSEGTRPRLYGHKKLSGPFKKHPNLFEIEERSPPGSNVKHFYVRARTGR